MKQADKEIPFASFHSEHDERKSLSGHSSSKLKEISGRDLVMGS
jgi:hypothetical protein